MISSARASIKGLIRGGGRARETGGVNKRVSGSDLNQGCLKKRRLPSSEGPFEVSRDGKRQLPEPQLQ